jgi:hypothetical protein
VVNRGRQKWKRPTGPRPAGLGVVVVVAAVAVGTLVAGCSSGPGAPAVASLNGHGAATTVTPSTLSNAQMASQGDADFVNYARCLRSHGVNEPDPVHHPGHSGLSIEVPSPSPANRAALAACNHFIAKIVATKTANGSRELAAWLPALTRYAACMRSHDIDMLDPGPQGQLDLGSVPGITSSFGRYSPQFRAADAACRRLLPRQIHDDGTGP